MKLFAHYSFQNHIYKLKYVCVSVYVKPGAYSIFINTENFAKCMIRSPWKLVEFYLHPITVKYPENNT